MTKHSTALTELVEKGCQDDIVRELLGHVVERLMEFEVEQRCGAEVGAETHDSPPWSRASRSLMSSYTTPRDTRS